MATRVDRGARRSRGPTLRVACFEGGVGTRVLACVTQNRGIWKSGRITSVEDGGFAIRYDDGGCDEHVVATKILYYAAETPLRVRSRVAAIAKATEALYEAADDASSRGQVSDADSESDDVEDLVEEPTSRELAPCGSVMEDLNDSDDSEGI